jgi:hypothetical protein
LSSSRKSRCFPTSLYSRGVKQGTELEPAFSGL